MLYDDIELEYDEIDIDESDNWTTEQFIRKMLLLQVSSVLPLVLPSELVWSLSVRL